MRFVPLNLTSFYQVHTLEVQHGLANKSRLRGASEYAYYLQMQHKHILLLGYPMLDDLSKLSYKEPDLAPCLATFVMLGKLGHEIIGSLKFLATAADNLVDLYRLRSFGDTSTKQGYNSWYLLWTRLQAGQAKMTLISFELQDLRWELFYLSIFKIANTNFTTPQRIVDNSQQIICHLADQRRENLIIRWLYAELHHTRSQKYHEILPHLERFFFPENYVGLKKQVYRYAAKDYKDRLDQVLEERRNTQIQPLKGSGTPEVEGRVSPATEQSQFTETRKLRGGSHTQISTKRNVARKIFINEPTASEAPGKGSVEQS